ncbi:MAG: DNA alkylation repair protein [Promethearchaeota archaeon]
MTISISISNDIKQELKISAPTLTQDQITRRDKIFNSDNPNFKCHGHKIPVIESIVKKINNKYQCSYNEAIEVFKFLINSNIHEEKFAAVFFLNLFKKNFNEFTIDLFKSEFTKYCDTWALCDSTMVRVIGPFLGKRGKEELAKQTIEEWSNSENMWVRRASMVILLKITMMKKDFNKDRVFEIVEKMLQFPEDYIQKGIGWLLKTCTKYDPDVIINYLEKNKKHLPRLILRYATEKLPKEERARILKK